MADYPLSKIDGLPMRPSGIYAWEKLEYVAKYQDIFATGMKNEWTHVVYVDLLAGCGRCGVEQTGDEFPGSPVRSLEYPFTKRIFIEEDPVLVAALKARVPADCLILTADCNAPDIVQQVRAAIPSRDALTLAFVDNLGLDARFETLRVLTEGRKVDLMIVFQVQALTRNIREVLEGKRDRSKVDAFFGTPDWETVARDLFAMNAAPSEVTNALMGFYQQRLQRIGYGHTTECQQVMKNSQNAHQYRLVLAGKHPLSVDFFKRIEKIRPFGQRSFLD